MLDSPELSITTRKAKTPSGSVSPPSKAGSPKALSEISGLGFELAVYSSAFSLNNIGGSINYTPKA